MAQKKEVKKVSDLQFDKRNANKHSEYGTRRLEKSINKIGLGRSILISDDNEIIAGNRVTESAVNSGIDKVRVIETDGTEIIAVKRTDIKSGSKEFYEMALSDNIIAKENIVMDAEVTNAICEEYKIDDYKIDYTKGHSVNNMNEFDLDMNEIFDPIGVKGDSKNVVFVFKSSIDAKKYCKKNGFKITIKGELWKVEMSTQSI